MNWRIVFYSETVSQTIKEMPVGIRAVYARISAKMTEFGPNLGMGYVRSSGKGLF